MAEALLRRRLSAAGVEATVSSAGLYEGGRPATAHGVATMAERGLDISGHRSRQLAAELVARADLVIGMAREHVREVAVLDSEALAKAFTLKELVRAGERAGGRRRGEPLAAWLARVGAGRRTNDLLGMGRDPALDVEDPIGRDRQEYEATARELDDLLRRLVRLLVPDAEEERAS